jgi:hypothetical protein
MSGEICFNKLIRIRHPPVSHTELHDYSKMYKYRSDELLGGNVQTRGQRHLVNIVYLLCYTKRHHGQLATDKLTHRFGNSLFT